MILVFGKTGQVARELKLHKDVIALGEMNRPRYSDNMCRGNKAI